MFFESWENLIMIVLVGSLSYIGLLFLLRFSGKRLLAQLTAAYFIGTVAIGSILANVIITKSIPLADGVLGLSLIIGLQLLAAWLLNLNDSERTYMLNHAYYITKGVSWKKQ